jgi:hypothetical protein
MLPRPAGQKVWNNLLITFLYGKGRKLCCGSPDRDLESRLEDHA